MSDDESKRHWVFRVHLADRAGALTSIASAFSNRGISIDTVIGHGAAHTTSHDGTVVVTFWCTEREKDEIVRVVRRLSKITGLEEHPYESEILRKSALVHVTRKLTPRDVAGRETFLTCEPIQEGPKDFVYYLAGSPSELDPIVNRFIEDGILEDIVYSVVGL
jgi:acetolactate synthase small subunit